ncbi:hypothetical protein OGM63_13550 [Plectonema radiosum NIES-515]|uniref:Uncharacterized protein n=1 Tax=Plectonema radiosum NIES-515 TaxID=2986073 RepID=A0ABT3AZV9_9CYAN|nr:hypothetical protein [Plectonema radiosum]MCV3214525.1 hypothetical protein [Plectonema radiosum NIES-515]
MTTISSKTMQPEQEFKRAFEPLTSRKDGKAQLTYAGYQHSINKNGGAFLKIVFSVLDVTGKNPANITVLSSYRYSDKNVLGRLLTLMGYSHQSKIVIADADDEFGHIVEENLETIYDFLDEQKGLVFKAFCTVSESDTFYRIDVSSIEACLDKNGKHKRAYEASEGIGNESLSIDIDAQGGDN